MAAELEAKAAEPGFWDDMEQSQKILQKTKQLKDKIESYEQLASLREDTLMMIDLAEEDNDASLVDEVKSAVDQITSEIEKMTLETLLNGPYDKNNAIMTFHAGAGGTEAQDWCQMLIRMYQMWAQKNGYTVTVLDSLDGDEAGIKSCTIEINGTNAYGYLKAEKKGISIIREDLFPLLGSKIDNYRNAIESIINQPKVKLSKRYKEYLYAKENDFKDIRDLESFFLYILCGNIHSKDNDKKDNIQIIMN